ncbi:4448_t:CDS:2 [Acaulospora colombiana]|uniref:4448_t:CDS:1 n=1 Tax=Acaulospora colombiana TaxID=27376 RepID=A0ACA9L9U6_9GLOM|nr:4448_t:CDS:2 [Acaulospora colombiana]
MPGPGQDFFHNVNKSCTFDFEDYIKTELGLGATSESGDMYERYEMRIQTYHKLQGKSSGLQTLVAWTL